MPYGLANLKAAQGFYDRRPQEITKQQGSQGGIGSPKGKVLKNIKGSKKTYQGIEEFK
jgi:hypothetical protein